MPLFKFSLQTNDGSISIVVSASGDGYADLAGVGGVAIPISVQGTGLAGGDGSVSVAVLARGTALAGGDCAVSVPVSVSGGNRHYGSGEVSVTSAFNISVSGSGYIIPVGNGGASVSVYASGDTPAIGGIIIEPSTIRISGNGYRQPFGIGDVRIHVAAAGTGTAESEGAGTVAVTLLVRGRGVTGASVHFDELDGVLKYESRRRKI